MSLGLTERNFARFVTVITFTLLLSGVMNVYVVLRNWELYRAARKSEERLQQAGQNQQMLQGLFRDLVSLAQQDQNLVAIFQKHQLVNPPSGSQQP